MRDLKTSIGRIRRGSGARPAVQPGIEEKSIVVLPFENLSPDPESVRFTLDFIGRLNPKAKEIKTTDFSDLSLLEEIHKSRFIDKLYQ